MALAAASVFSVAAVNANRTALCNQLSGRRDLNRRVSRAALTAAEMLAVASVVSVFESPEYLWDGVC